MRIVVIGNGAAGTTAAFNLAEICEKTDITILSVDIFPEYSPCVLSRYLSGTIDRNRVFLKSLRDYREQGIKILLAEKVVKIDAKKKVVLSDKREVPYDKLIVATGSRAVAPRIPGVDKRGVFFFRSLKDADKILDYGCQTVAVIGAGPIGVEVCISLKERGLKVILIELEKQILPRVFDREPALLLEKCLKDQGIKVFVDEKVLEIRGTNAVEEVITSTQKIDCDTVILATGVVPEAELARQAGLEIGELGGIKVNKQMLTSVPDIFACGDCIEVEDLLTRKLRLSLKWYDARLQAVVASSNCVGKYKEYQIIYMEVQGRAHGCQVPSVRFLQNTPPP